MTTWKGLKNDLSISQEDQNAIALEKDLIRAMVAIREEKGLTQSQLAEMCNVKQPVIARIEASSDRQSFEDFNAFGLHFTDRSYG